MPRTNRGHYNHHTLIRKAGYSTLTNQSTSCRWIQKAHCSSVTFMQQERLDICYEIRFAVIFFALAPSDSICHNVYLATFPVMLIMGGFLWIRYARIDRKRHDLEGTIWTRPCCMSKYYDTDNGISSKTSRIREHAGFGSPTEVCRHERSFDCTHRLKVATSIGLTLAVDYGQLVGLDNP
ncbi:hypothetical protein BC939DRAFT_193781 [Gamsiella multidivaricata]|uniref:uncharacterized protein n=1 Tax=Gamsiella multidivaricata TaxID=101098 RepID=UPI00221F003A|nr:uncharacterized protein BC939DRAFT_193781 [Gamsiella multidivaricata]KAI7822209.1 hypothetical protein BC939DRAFT_193781 [Gamsiella multidivaricata]